MEKEEIGSIRKMMPAMDYPLIHDFVASSPVFIREIEDLDMAESALMGNLLTDMLGGQFYGSNRPLGPDVLQFSGDQNSSKMSFLQMLEETEVGKEAPGDPFHLKLPILEEQPDQKNLSHSPEISTKSCKVETNPQSEENDEENAENENCKSEKFAAPANSGHSSERQAENNNNNQAGQIGSDVPISQSSSGTENQTKPKRKRAKSSRNSEEVESQRQTHIAVERNRRKQMNEHLGVLRSLMPGSYVQRGDQASIIGGAIEFVKELEQLLQCLQAQKRRKMYAEVFSPKVGLKAGSNPAMASSNPAMGSSVSAQSADSKYINENCMDGKEELAESKSEIADVEVKMAGSDALVKILSQRRPGQLLKAIAGLESLCLVILHTNVTTIEQTVLYSFNVKLGLECRLSVDEIAAAVQQIFTMIHSGACIP